MLGSLTVWVVLFEWQHDQTQVSAIIIIIYQLDAWY